MWRAALLVAVLGFVYATMLSRLTIQWWTDENYSHGLLIPFVIAYILWSTRARLLRVPKRPAILWGGASVVFALFMLWAGTAGAELYLQRLSLVLMLAGIVLYFWGWRVLRLLLVPLALLALAIPVPAIIFNQVAFPLQLFASRCAVWAMQLLDIPVLRQGNVIELMPLGATTTKKLEVVEACSGIRSLMTLVTLAVVFAYFTYPRAEDKSGGRFSWLKRYGFWRAGVIVLSAVPIAIVTNAARVSGTGILARFYGTRVADGFFHEFSGWVVYIVAFLLLFAVGWLLDLFARRKRKGKGGPRAQSLTDETQMTATTTLEVKDESSSDDDSSIKDMTAQPTLTVRGADEPVV
ncbi:MAG: exosortase [Acidobacteria bacterium]|nr:MAG: exosortase [Acidobacteriota bacterium]